MPPLSALVTAGFDVALVVSQPDRRRGRGSALVATPVKAAALELGLPVSERIDDVLATGADLGVVVAYGRLIRPPVLTALSLVNLHFSLLPRWRGAAPVERSILAGDEETGVCLMALEQGLDTGPVYACERVAIGSEETAGELRGRLAEIGSRLLVDALSAGLGAPVPQEGEVTYAAKIDPAELELDWAQPVMALHRRVRVGRAWTTFRGRRLRVLKARPVPVPPTGPPPPVPGMLSGTVVATAEGALELVEVQPEGKGPLPAAAWVNGARLGAGERLGR